MDKSEILETVKAAKKYLQHLNDLEDEIKCAEKQISNTFEEAQKNIRETFHNLKESLITILENRERNLLNEAKKSKDEGLLPLHQCHTVIQQKIQNTTKLIKLGESLDRGGQENGLNSFATESSLLGSLPEVPELKEVPYITFNFEQSTTDELKSICLNFGEVCRIAPIQITGLQPKPGALLVEWHPLENEDRLRDIQEFRLQRAYGNVLKDKHLVANFADCYKGLEAQYLVRDLQLSQQYSFRVCCKFEGASDWCPWSLIQVASTSIKHFCWKKTDGFLLTNENRIATNLNNVDRILYSDGAQFSYGHSLEFTILDVDHKTSAVIGLVTKMEDSSKSLKDFSGNSFLIDSNGNIFIDGTEKSTKLAKLSQGLKISFTCELHNNNKIRINVDLNDKRVTYDWPIDADCQVFFACQLDSSDWKIMVE